MSQDILVECALLGTDRSPELPIPSDPAVTDLLTRIAAVESTPAQRLLRTAAVLGVCSRVGFEPSLMEFTLTGPAQGDPESPTPSALLSPLFQLSSRRPLAEALSAIASSRMRIPGSLLREALDLGQKSTEIRPWIVAALGERGRWFASQDTSWSYAKSVSSDGDDDQQWQFGSLQQRLNVLRRQRGVDPAAARTRLIADWGQLPPAERAALLSVLSVGLSVEDEATLTSCLSDRAREPRRIAAALLAVLPNSAHAQRAEKRLAKLVQKKGGLLGVGGSWSIEPPEQFEEEWKADGFVLEKPANHPLGERAWWLHQAVAAVSPAWWSAHTGMSAEELVVWASKSAWSDAILPAWVQFAQIVRLDGWAHALLQKASRKHTHAVQKELNEQIQVSERDASWLNDLKKTPANEVAQEIIEIVPLGQCISLELSNALLRGLLKEMSGSGRSNWRASSCLVEAVCLIHPAALSALKSLTAPSTSEDHVQQSLEQARIHVQARTAFQQWMASNSITNHE
jgi:hypothetical protein